MRSVLLVEAVDGEYAQQLEATGGQARHADRHPAEVGRGIGQRDRARQDLAHCLGLQAEVGDEQDGAQVARRVETQRLEAALARTHHRETAEKSGGGIVRVPLDLGSETEQVRVRQRLAKQRVARNETAHGRRRR